VDVVRAVLAIGEGISLLNQPSVQVLTSSRAHDHDPLVAVDVFLFAGDRYVSSQAFCLRGEYAWPAWVPSADTRDCPVGYTCRSDPPWPFFDD
jgi:hypothetical protein